MANRNYVAIANKYCRDVVSGREIACKWVKLACKRHLADLKRKTSKDWPYYFSKRWGSDICDFSEKFPHVEGVWDNPNIVLEPVQIFIYSTVFGWRRQVGRKKDEDTDPRKYNTCYIEVARKNAKSTFSAPVGLYCLTCEGEVGPQVKSAATTGDQARIVWGIAKKMAEASPDFREAFDVNPMANSIPCHMNQGSFQPINAKASTQDGLNPSCAIIDELHAHKDRSLFDVLKSARGARKNPLSWYITTAGYNMAGVCYEQRLLAQKILEGTVPAEHYFAIIFTLDKGDDCFDSRVWKKANPLLGVSVQINELTDYAQEAKESPLSLGEYKTKRMNMWLNAASSWLNMVRWDECEDPSLKIEDFAGCEAWIGGDLADKDDVAALAIVFRDGEDIVAFPRFYLPEDLVDELAHKTHAHYRAWADAGIFTLTPGDYIDHNWIERDIRRWCEKYRVQEVVLDQYGSAQMAASLNDDGITTIILAKNAKNYTDPAKELESRIKRKRFRHDGNPCLKWMASNCAVDIRVDGSILPKKESKESQNKIDGIDALIGAMSRAINPQEGRSVYEDRGILSA